MNARDEKSGLPADRRDQRRDERCDERGDERAERGADDDGDRELDDVAAQHEVAEFLEHGQYARTRHGRLATLHCLIEIPKGSRNKYEWDPDLQAIKLNRFLFSSRHLSRPTTASSPTRSASSGEALDALVCVSAADLPRLPDRGARRRRPAHERRGGQSDKLVCVPTDDPAWDEVEGVDGLPAPAAHGDPALLLDVQAAGGQGSRRPRLGGPRGRRARRSTRAAALSTEAQLVASVPLLSARGIDEVVRRARGAVRARPRARRRRAHRRARAQRRRQVDAAAHPRRRGAPGRRHGHQPPRARARLAAADRRGRRPRPRSPPCSTRGPS